MGLTTSQSTIQSAQTRLFKKASTLLILISAIFGSFIFLEVSPLELFSSQNEFSRLAGEMWPPTIDNLPRSLELLFETLIMALAGTLIGSLVALPLSFLATKAIAGNNLVRVIAKGFITAARAIPALVFALILVRLLGFGPLVGALALSLSSVGMIGRQVVDSLDTIPRQRFELGLAQGLTRSQVLISSGLPIVIPTLVSSVLHRLEINLRSSAVLGFVGAGGIGILLVKDLGQLNYSGALGTTSLIVALVFVSESLSSRIRLRIMEPGGQTGHLSGSGVRVRDPALTLYGVTGIALALSGGALFFLTLFSSNSIRAFESVLVILNKSWPPNFDEYGSEILFGIIESFAMAIAGTSLGLIFAVPLALLGSSNIVRTRMVNRFARFIMSAVRSTPDLIFALFFVSAVGLGPSAGVYAIAIGTGGILGKFLADSLEEAPWSTREAFDSIGLSRAHYLLSAALPERRGALVASIFHMADINIRISIGLGVIGLGGIGMLLTGALSALAFDSVTAILLGLVIIVALLEKTTTWIKRTLQ